MKKVLSQNELSQISGGYSDNIGDVCTCSYSVCNKEDECQSIRSGESATFIDCYHDAKSAVKSCNEQSSGGCKVQEMCEIPVDEINSGSRIKTYSAALLGLGIILLF